MRKTTSPKLRAATLALCAIGLALGLASLILAFTVQGPARNLRPILSYAESAYVPMYIDMSAAGLLIVASLGGIISQLYGNKGLDIAACVILAVAAILALAALGLAGGLKAGSAQTGLEASLAGSLQRYGASEPAIFEAWNQMQIDSRCCAVRTNDAQMAYKNTPWYRKLSEGTPHTTPNIPDSCCQLEARSDPSKLADCTNNKPAVPSQNPLMNPVGCFEASTSSLEAYSNRHIIVGVVVFFGAVIAAAPIAFGLVQGFRQRGSNGTTSQVSKQQFGNSRPGSVAGSIRGQQSLLTSQPLRSGSSVYNSRHSLFSEPAGAGAGLSGGGLTRPTSEASLPSVAGRSLFSEPPVRPPPNAIQAQPVRPRKQQQPPPQAPPMPKPRSSLASSSVAAQHPSDMTASFGTMNSLPATPQPPTPPQPPPQPLQAQPMKRPPPQQQQKHQQPIALSAQPLRPRQQQQRQPPGRRK